MQARTWMVWAIVPGLLAAAAVEKRIERHLPPFELGTHNIVVEAQSNRSGVDGPHVGNCPVFPRDNVWNTPVDELARDPRSDAYIASIGPSVKLHPDFGSALVSGIPFTEVPPGTKPSRTVFQYSDDSDLGNYPVPANVPIEGGGVSGDRHAIFIDPRRCILYEIFLAVKAPDGTWTGGSGIKMDLTSNALRGDGKTSADAAGLPILPGLVRYEEVAAGEINHAIRFTIPHTQAAYIWPARHKASNIKNPNVPPLGLRLRLRGDFDISGYSKSNQVILKALKRYGMFLADNGSAIFLSGTSDKRWDDDDLHKLGRIVASDFEAVDESNWQMLADSARVDPVAIRH